MSAVTITGSAVTPSTFLAPGVTVTVALTPLVEKLIARGYVVVTSTPAAAPESAPVEDDAEDLPAEETGHTIPDDDGVPPRNASRAVWAEFMEEKGFTVLGNHTRDELISRWDETRG